MDTKKRIKELMDERGWTMYMLSKKSGISQTALANMYKRNTEPTIPTLEAICNAFGITLSQFFAVNQMIELTEEQKQLFDCWISLEPEQKELLLKIIKSFK